MGRRESFFHGTDRTFEPGSMLRPPYETGVQPNFPASDDTRVYMATTEDEAATYGKHVYEVEPDGEVEPDYYFPDTARTARTARVLRRLR